MTEMKFHSAEWSDGDKAARLGGALGANSIIRGRLTKTGERLVIIMDILDINTARVTASSQVQFADINEVFGGITSLAHDAAAKLPD
jgi:hypothetical protein